MRNKGKEIKINKRWKETTLKRDGMENKGGDGQGHHTLKSTRIIIQRTAHFQLNIKIKCNNVYVFSKVLYPISIFQHDA